MNLRKNLIVLTVVLSGVLASLLFLNFQEFGKNQKAQILETDNKLSNLPVKISKGLVDYFNLNGSGKVIFYEKLDSMVYEASLDGKSKKELARIPGVSEVIFNPVSLEIIATIRDTDGLGKSYFNLENNQKIKLDQRIRNAAFSPDGANLAYFFYDENYNEGNISISKPDGSDFINIFKTRSKNLKILWPAKDLIVFYPETENSELSAFSIKPDGKEFKRLMESEYLAYSNQKPKEEILKNLGIEASNIKLDLLETHLVFINAKDGKLYSLKI
ncbi:MAG: hypothetical protein G01um10142_80 [Parcubacteria group bacterium Gr01-1014_2]|nr:MAG: hypothetical protein G01um10142_80 [Parcubacteria group bacterium Gr01-1014_2]